MQKRTKVILSTSVVLLVTILGAVSYIIYRSHVLPALPIKRVEIVIHDPNSVNSERTCDAKLHCSIQLPRGFVREDTLPGTFIAASSKANIQITYFPNIADTKKFSSFVAKRRQDHLPETWKVIDEGTTIIGGLNAYVITFLGKDQAGRTNKFYNVYVDAKDTVFPVFYGLTASALESDWEANVDAIDSSLSTFKVGDDPAR